MNSKNREEAAAAPKKSKPRGHPATPVNSPAPIVNSTTHTTPSRKMGGAKAKAAPASSSGVPVGNLAIKEELQLEVAPKAEGPQSVQDPKAFPCPHPGCQKSLPTQRGMKLHLHRHNVVKQEPVEEPEDASEAAPILVREEPVSDPEQVVEEEPAIPEKQEEEIMLGPIESQLIPCTHPGCQKSFPTQKGLNRHFASHRVVKQEPVDEERVPEDQDPLPDVLEREGVEDPNLSASSQPGTSQLFPCTFPGCKAGPYSLVYNLRRHLRKSHRMSVEQAQEHVSAAHGASDVVEEDKIEEASEAAPALVPEPEKVVEEKPEDPNASVSQAVPKPIVEQVPVRNPAPETEQVTPSVQDQKAFPCHHPGCPRSFDTQQGMKRHLANHRVVKQEPVNEEQIPEDQNLLPEALEREGVEDPNLSASSQPGNSNVILCPRPGCDRWFNTEKGMKRHVATCKSTVQEEEEPMELEEQIPEEAKAAAPEPEQATEKAPKLFPCPHPGCPKSFPTQRGLKLHSHRHKFEVELEPVEEQEEPLEEAPVLVPEEPVEEQVPKPEQVVEEEAEDTNVVSCTVPQAAPEEVKTVAHPIQDQKAFPCHHPGCQRSFNTQQGMKRHLANHRVVKQEPVDLEQILRDQGLLPEALEREGAEDPNLSASSQPGTSQLILCPRPGCDRSFNNEKGMKRHAATCKATVQEEAEPIELEEQIPEEPEAAAPEPQQAIEEGEPKAEKKAQNSFPCLHPGCPKSFPTQKRMKIHFRWHKVKVEQEPVEEQEEAPKAAAALVPEEPVEEQVPIQDAAPEPEQLTQSVQDPKAFPCPHPGCPKSLPTHRGMRLHFNHHKVVKQEPVEEQEEASEAAPAPVSVEPVREPEQVVEEEPAIPEEQEDEIMLGQPIQSQVVPCIHPGCPRSFESEFGMKCHLASHKMLSKRKSIPGAHTFPCFVVGCEQFYQLQASLKRHLRTAHGIVTAVSRVLKQEPVEEREEASEAAPVLVTEEPVEEQVPERDPIPEPVPEPDQVVEEKPEDPNAVSCTVPQSAPEDSEEVKTVTHPVQDQKAFPCPHPGCQSSFDTQKGMKVHFSHHTVVKQEPVDEEQIPEDEDPLPDVLEREEAEDPNLSASSSKLFACMFHGCSHSYQHKTSLTRHMKKDHGVKSESVASMARVQDQSSNQSEGEPQPKIPKLDLDEVPKVQSDVVLDAAAELLEFDLGIDEDEVTLDGNGMPLLERFDNFKSGKARKMFVCTYDRCKHAPFKSCIRLRKHIMNAHHKNGELEMMEDEEELETNGKDQVPLVKIEREEEVVETDEQPGSSKLKCPYAGCPDSFDSQRGYGEHLLEHRQVAARQLSEEAEPVEILQSKSRKSVSWKDSTVESSSMEDSTISSSRKDSDEYPDDLAPYPVSSGLFDSEYDDYTAPDPQKLDLKLMWSEEYEKPDPMIPMEKKEESGSHSVQETLQAYKCSMPGCRNNRFVSEQNLAKHYLLKHNIPYELSDDQPIMCKFPGCIHRPFKSHHGLTRHVNQMHKAVERNNGDEQRKTVQTHPQKVVHIKEQSPPAASTEPLQPYTVEFPEEDYRGGLSSSGGVTSSREALLEEEDSDEYDNALDRVQFRNQIYQQHIQQQQMMMMRSQDDGEEQDLSLYGSGPLETWCHFRMTKRNQN
ncbi:unnamed protein product [Caenorhabditis brenneri]